MSEVLGGDAHGLQGVISLQAFAGHVVTFDFAHDRIVLETPASAEARTRRMRQLVARLATGPSGGSLGLFVGVPAGVGHSATTLWLEWDSGHRAPTFLAPHAASLLGVPDATPRADATIALGGALVAAPVVVKDVIYDGVLSAGVIERSTWTADLAEGRLWVSDVAPIGVLPPSDAATRVAPPREELAGVYEMIATVQDRPEPGVLTIRREGGALRGTLRNVGEEREQAVRDVRLEGDTLTYVIAFGAPTTVRVVFDGLSATGTWSDSAGHSGAMRVVKRS
jgi:hypothetical protein